MQGQKRQYQEGDCDTLTHEKDQTKTQEYDKDSINQLPDEILARILSSLPLNEAPKTSVLSRRWRHLWARISSLNIVCIYLTPQYINSTNKICSSIQSRSIENLRIIAQWGDYDQAIVDGWVRFALEKKVKNLELITNASWFNRCVLSCPAAFVSSGSNKHLKSLTLKYVSISGENLQQFLANCTALEHVSVENSRKLTSLKVAGRDGDPFQQINLKFLKIFHCPDLSDVRICAPKLFEFLYEGQAISFHIENVPSLCQVHLDGGRYDDCISWAFRALPEFLCQLQTLVLRSSTLIEMNFLRLRWWKLSSLRNLTLRISGYDDSSLLNLLFLLDAAPNLAKFTFESDIKPSEFLLKEKTIGAPCPHQNLKVLEIVGCVGRANVVNFIRHAARAAPKLEKVTFDPFLARRNFIPKWENRVIFTNQFEVRFDELLKSGIYQPVEFVLLLM